ncbi:Mov34/MPN/PAD-1 family protein [Allorhodopirellula solitaria]|uniref:Mov34/MPN/PAD-1 family protein n=1 Tax=Allorhodopirellula solitaria TaxID=2527987 RepID=UPI001FE49A80|nr:Mov34/MPN/PAD-1 family protein [Allorhodopirellula solitaria]
MQKTNRSNRVLRFSPFALAKLVYLRDIGPTEIGGFGISNADDLLLIEDIQLVRQTCSVTSVEFDDASVADFFDSQVDAGRQPEQFARVWVHTHPGASPSPSQTDEETFSRCFGGVDWCVMHILAEEGNTYTRARFNVGPGTDRRLRCRTVLDCEFPATDHEKWFEEYCENVTVFDPFASRRSAIDLYDDADWWQQPPTAADLWSDRLFEVGR